jgi:dihydrofolate synthase/folylpolyglutamate synthase
VAVLDQLEALGLASVECSARRQGLEETVLPGRLESVSLSGGPRYLLDGAHNPHAALALTRALAGIDRRRLIAVLGVSRGKDASGIAAALASTADEIVVTQSRQDRAMPGEELSRVVRGVRPDLAPSLAASTAAALDLAGARAGAEDLVLVAGSLFVVGEAREHLCGVDPDPVGLSDPVESGAATR